MPLIKFHEVLLDPDIVLAAEGGQSPISGFPEFKNEHHVNEKTGVWKTNVGRLDPPEMLSLDVKLLSDTARRYFLRFYRGGFGSAIGFRFQVPYDYRVTDEVIATAQTGVLEYPLYVTYVRPGITTDADARRIVKPVTNLRLKDLGAAGGSVTLLKPDASANRVISQELVIKVGGVTVTNYTVNNTTGRVFFTSQPTAGQPISVTMEYDIPAAFMPTSPEQKFDVNSEITSLFIREILPAELGLS